MTHDQAFKLMPDGSYDIQPAGILLLLAHEVSTTPPTPVRAKLQGRVQAFIQAAIAGGYREADVLITVLANGETSRRTSTMCQAACEAAGPERMAEVLDSLRAGYQAG